jgi:hypothetical protein
MTTTIKQKLTFKQFLEQCPEEGLYELVDGEIDNFRFVDFVQVQTLLHWHGGIYYSLFVRQLVLTSTIGCCATIQKTRNSSVDRMHDY